MSRTVPPNSLSPFLHLEQRVIDPHHTFLYLDPTTVETRARYTYWMHDPSIAERWALFVQDNLFRNEDLPFEKDLSLQRLREWSRERSRAMGSRHVPVLGVEWKSVFGNGLEPLYNDVYVFAHEGFYFLNLFSAEIKFSPYQNQGDIQALFPNGGPSKVVVAMALHVQRALLFEGLNGYVQGWIDAGRIYERLWILFSPMIKEVPFSHQYREVERFLKISGDRYGLQWMFQILRH